MAPERVIPGNRTWTLGLSDEGLMTEVIAECPRVLIDALGKSQTAADDIVKRCWKVNV